MVKQQIGELKLGGKIFPIFEPSIGQRLRHTAELEQTRKDMQKWQKKKEEEGFSDKYDAFLRAWYLRELKIFIPEFTKEDLEKIDHNQRAKIFELIFGIEPAESEVPAEKKTTSRRKKGGSHGGKS
jgi:hypothetical protein